LLPEVVLVGIPFAPLTFKLIIAPKDAPVRELITGAENGVLHVAVRDGRPEIITSADGALDRLTLEIPSLVGGDGDLELGHFVLLHFERTIKLVVAGEVRGNAVSAKRRQRTKCQCPMEGPEGRQFQLLLIDGLLIGVGHLHRERARYVQTELALRPRANNPFEINLVRWTINRPVGVDVPHVIRRGSVEEEKRLDAGSCYVFAHCCYHYRVIHFDFLESGLKYAGSIRRASRQLLMIIKDDGGGALDRRAGVASHHKQQHLAGSGF